MIVFNEDGCIKCGACEGACPTSTITVTPTYIQHCDMCGEDPKCAEVCPEGALKVEMFTVDENALDQPRLTFNSSLCTSCGKCEEVCPQKTCVVVDKPNMEVEGFCVMCKQCVEICPVQVIGIPGIIEPKDCGIDLEGKGATYIVNCVGCGTCVEPCPVDAITLDKIGGTISIDESVCIKCGVCSQTCPWNAVFISEKYPVKREKEIIDFTFTSSKCIGCNTCVEACPGDFIKTNAGNLTIELPKICAACGLCVNVCPTDSLDLVVEWGEAHPADAEGLGYDPEKCEFIGACANKCPTEAIRVVTKTGMACPSLVQTDEDPSFVNCIRCGACAAVCPEDALTVGSIEKMIDGKLQLRDRIEFNPSKCTKCGDCVVACPYDMIHLTDDDKLPIKGFCTLCGQCIEACPEHALYDK